MSLLSLPERIVRNIEPEPMSGCWLWAGGVSATGYAQIRYRGERHGHRAVWILLKGPIPADKELDHLCRVRSCINPDHLEPVTHRVNILRSPINPTAINARKTLCVRGHVLTLRAGGRFRICRSCQRRHQSEYRQRTPERPSPERAAKKVTLNNARRARLLEQIEALPNGPERQRVCRKIGHRWSTAATLAGQPRECTRCEYRDVVLAQPVLNP